MKNENENQKGPYWRLGLTIFLSLATTVTFSFILFHIQTIKDFFDLILSALRPVIVGIVLAYLLCPIENALERLLNKIKIKRYTRLISTLLTLVLAFAVIALFCVLLLPQLAESVRGLIADLPNLLKTQLDRIEAYLATNDEAADNVMQVITSIETYAMEWIRTNMLSTVTTVATSVISIGSAIINSVVAIIVTIYLLLDRERYLAQCRKLFFAVSKNKRINQAVLDAVHQTDRIFSGFIRGKLVDSLIVGVICFICLAILRMPYALLISVIIGVTNIIPMFGPFIGAIPSAFLLLLVSPSKCLVFLIFIVILQQVDGNIIGPRILGDSTGLSALYVTVAMLVFGKLLGFTGMLIGVPLFATLYYIVKRLAESSLKKQGKPTDTQEYIQ